MSDTIKLIGNFEIEFDNENDMHAFIGSLAVVGKIKYKAYKEYQGEEKVFHEISHTGKKLEEQS